MALRTICGISSYCEGLDCCQQSWLNPHFEFQNSPFIKFHFNTGSIAGEIF